MSFDIYNKKPKLVEPKILKYYNEKQRNKELKEQFKLEEQQRDKQQLDIQQEEPVKWYTTMGNNIINFVKENYGFFLIVSLIIILLYVRYIEVEKRKQKMKTTIDQINKEKQIQQFIELQQINKELSKYN